MASDGCILVVDDDPTILATVVELLELEGYEVAMARNGAEAMDIVRGSVPALILLDMRMPVLDGWGFTRALREGGYEPPVVIMSAAHDAHRWAEEVGAHASVAKPFEADDLLAIVKRALNPDT